MLLKGLRLLFFLLLYINDGAYIYGNGISINNLINS